MTRRARRCYWLRWYNTSTPFSISSLAAHDFEGSPVNYGPTFDSSGTLSQYDGYISQDLEDVLADFSFIATFPSPVRRTKEDRARISKAIYDAEYKLITLHHASQFGDESSVDRDDDLSPIVSNAAQLYLFVVLSVLIPDQVSQDLFSTLQQDAQMSPA